MMPLLRLALSYGVLLAAMVAGFLARMAVNVAVLHVPQYHCFTYEPWASVSVFALVLVAPIVLFAAQELGRLSRVPILVAAGVTFILSMFVVSWNPADLMPCAPL
jgi:hypothetical protein